VFFQELLRNIKICVNRNSHTILDVIFSECILTPVSDVVAGYRNLGEFHFLHRVLESRGVSNLHFPGLENYEKSWKINCCRFFDSVNGFGVYTIILYYQIEFDVLFSVSFQMRLCKIDCVF